MGLGSSWTPSLDVRLRQTACRQLRNRTCAVSPLCALPRRHWLAPTPRPRFWRSGDGLVLPYGPPATSWTPSCRQFASFHAAKAAHRELLSLTTTSHPRVSGVLRYAGDLQHRSGQPAHQYRVHGAAAGSGRALFDGRSRSLSGQCVHQAVFIKRLWRSLKYEAVYLRQLADGFMAQRVIDEWSSSPTRCDRARHWMVGRRRPPTAGSRRPDRRWRSGHGEQVAIAGSEGRGPAGAQSGKGGYPQCPQDQAPLPRTSTPFYRHLFLTARGALTITRIYLDLPPGGEPNLPLPTSIEMTPDASAVVTFHRNHWKGSPEYAVGHRSAAERQSRLPAHQLHPVPDHQARRGELSQCLGHRPGAHHRQHRATGARRAGALEVSRMRRSTP